MTVQELIDQLKRFRPDMEVAALWDTMPDWSIKGVHRLEDTVQIDVGSSSDWNAIRHDVARGEYPMDAIDDPPLPGEFND